MTIARMRSIIAGFLVLSSLALGVQASPVYESVHWLWLSAFVGINLFQSGITSWCLMDKILAKLGVPVTARCAA